MVDAQGRGAWVRVSMLVWRVVGCLALGSLDVDCGVVIAWHRARLACI